MITRGLQGKRVQVSFGKTHPICGTVFSISWDSLKMGIEKRLKDTSVVSFRINKNGLEVYSEGGDRSVAGADPFWKHFLEDK